MVEPDEWADRRPAEEPRALRFATLPEFVEHLSTWYRRDVVDTSGRVWCPRWFEHGEAVIRLEAIWRALEALRLDPSFGISVWLRDHCDVHMAVLMDPAGPFRGCHPKRGHSRDPVEPLALDRPPEGWWTPDDTGL